jgi:Flp pilus assembly protein TadD
MSPDDVEAWQLLARSVARLGRDESAQLIYKQRVAPERMKGEDCYLVGSGLVRQRNVGSAIKIMQVGLEVDPKHPESLQELARLYAQQDELARATGLAQRLATVPGWEARGDLLTGVLLAEQSDMEQASLVLARALKNDPALQGAAGTPAQARKLLARAWLRLGKPDQAREVLERVNSEGTDAEAAWLSSRVLLQAGDLAGATAALERSRDFGEESAFAQEPAPFVGAAKCAECHKAIHTSQQNSLHTRTFYPTSALDTISLPEKPVPDSFAPEVVHTIERVGDRVRVTTRVDEKELHALVDYAIGSGDRGLTLVGPDDSGQSRELRLSRYNDGTGWDVTIGQRPHPANPLDFLGLPLSADEVHGCVHCHTTDGKAARERRGPTVADRGIGCERCHGPGGNHVRAVEANFPDLAIARPQLFSADRQVKLCAQCHSPKGNVQLNPEDKTAIRFQTVHFVKSRCYTQSEGAMSCLTCHSPHRDAESSAAFYEAKCLSCHSAATPEHLPSSGKRRVSCSVNPTSGCLDCHMPVERAAIPHAPFSDHFIRVHPRERK